MDVKDLPQRIDTHHFRRVMGRFATGVTVITATAKGETRGMTASAFMSASLDPPLCVVSVAKRARMHELLLSAGSFGVDILAAGQEAVATHFAGKPDPVLDVPFAIVDGVPVLADACARILAETAASHDCGDHTLFVGHIRFMAADHRPPLVYHAGRFGAFAPAEDEEAIWLEFW
jgi:flavin reductase (DIM6/NTAB) family NADH-FMN oxidoreductase RutF